MKECSIELCMAYMHDNLDRIANSYNEIEKKKEFEYNLADDIASDWENCEYFINRLYKEKKINQFIKDKLAEINNDLIEASPGGKYYDDIIWTDEGLRTSPFWIQLRSKVNIILDALC